MSDQNAIDLGDIERKVSSIINAPFKADDIRVLAVLEFRHGEFGDSYAQIKIDPDMAHYYDTLFQRFSEEGVKVEIYPIKLSDKFNNTIEKLDAWVASVMPDQYPDEEYAALRTAYNFDDKEKTGKVTVNLDRKPTPEERRNIPTSLYIDGYGSVPVKLEVMRLG